MITISNPYSKEFVTFQVDREGLIEALVLRIEYTMAFNQADEMARLERIWEALKWQQ